MNNGNLNDVFLLTGLIAAIILIVFTLIYTSKLRRIRRLRKVTLPNLLSELERSCDLLLHSQESGRDPCVSYRRTSGGGAEYWLQFATTVSLLKEQLEHILNSWIYKRRGRSRGMRGVMTRVETAASRLSACQTRNAVGGGQQESLRVMVGKLNEIINTLQRAETEASALRTQHVHELEMSALYPRSYHADPCISSVTIVMPSRSCEAPPTHSDCFIDTESPEFQDLCSRHLPSSTHRVAASFIASERPGSAVTPRPGVLPSTFVKSHPTNNRREEQDTKHYANQQPSLLDLTPHPKHRAVVVKSAVDPGDFHASMRAAKYESLRRRDAVYVS